MRIPLFDVRAGGAIEGGAGPACIRPGADKWVPAG